MPTPAEKLPKGAKQGQVSAAISETIAMLMHEGREQDQAIAIAYSQAEKAIGREIPRKGK